MKLESTQRQIIQEEMDAAHSDATALGKFRSREVAAAFVKRMEDMERFGHPWVRQYLRTLMVSGAMKACADFRRPARHEARTRKGKRVHLPAFAAGRDHLGRQVQMRLDDMDRDALLTKRTAMATTRDTYSHEVAALDALLALMEANPELRTVGEALRAQAA